VSWKRKVRALPSAWREVREVVGTHRRRLALGLALVLVNRLAVLVMPLSSKYFVDEIVTKRRGELLVTISLVALGASLIQASTSFALARIIGVAAQRAVAQMRRSVYEVVVRLPVRFFDSTHTGTLLTRIMSDADGVAALAGPGFAQLLGGLFTAMLALGVLFYLNWRLTSIVVAAFVSFGFALTLALSRLGPLAREYGEIYAGVFGRLTESLGGVRVVKAYAAEGRESLVFARGVHRLLRNGAKATIASSWLGSFTIVLSGVIGAAMMLIGGGSILSGAMTLGDYVMYVFCMSLVAGPALEVTSAGSQIVAAVAGLARIREIKQLTTEDEGEEGRDPLGRVEGHIRFEDVTFEYVNGTPALSRVSFHAPAGSTTALVGPSGSGKSTMLSLITAFNSPLSGRVTIDGRDLATICLRDYRRGLGVVLQENFLFDGTIAENIAFGRPSATREQIRAVSRAAHCDDFIGQFEEGLDTVVGERGVRLSGGQRQRLAIARALLADPKVLILDEATSSLDSESESLIQDGLLALRRDRTTFVIAHRLSTIMDADQILVLESGCVVERGTHRELLAAMGHYRRLFDGQFKRGRDFVAPFAADRAGCPS
jgi:ABC-type multidrug transport system fused ATPase/permease subunit